jgi:MFS family permease
LYSKCTRALTFENLWQTIGSAAIAIANVIAEALVVEKSSGESQDYASRLQSIIWAGQAVGGIIAAWTGGFILTFMTDKQVFLLVGTFPLTLMAVAFLVPEKKYESNSQENGKIGARMVALWNAFSNPQVLSLSLSLSHARAFSSPFFFLERSNRHTFSKVTNTHTHSHTHTHRSTSHACSSSS